jgi:hypothetical protein
MAVRKKPEVRPSKDAASPPEPHSAISINRDTMVSLVFHSTIDKVEGLFSTLHKAVNRIGVTASKTVLSPPDVLVGTFPSNLDISRWSESILTKKHPDAGFMVSLYQAAKSRLSSAQIKNIIQNID